MTTLIQTIYFWHFCVVFFLWYYSFSKYNSNSSKQILDLNLFKKIHFFPFTFLQPYLLCSSTPVDYLCRSDNEFATHFTRPRLLGELIYLKNAKKWKHILATKHFKLHYLSNNRNLSSLTQKYNEIMLTQLMYITIHLWLFRVIQGNCKRILG